MNQAVETKERNINSFQFLEIYRILNGLKMDCTVKTKGIRETLFQCLGT